MLSGEGRALLAPAKELQGVGGPAQAKAGLRTVCQPEAARPAGAGEGVTMLGKGLTGARLGRHGLPSACSESHSS